MNAPPTTSNAGADQTICSTGIATLAANNPTVGTGTWSVVSGPSTSSTQFGNVNNSNTTFTNAGGAGTYTLRWTITNSPCIASTDDVVITVNAPPTTSNAGADQTLCLSTPSALAANTPPTGTGAWSIVSGPSLLLSQFSSTSNATATFTPANGGGVYTLRWTISNSPCIASTDDVQITYNPRPTGVISGTQTICNGTSATLSIAVTGTGPWSVTLSSGQAFSGNSSPLSVSVSPSGITTYTIAALSDANCVSVAADRSGSTTVTVRPTPTAAITINGTNPICSGSSSSIKFTGPSDGVVTYNINGGGNLTATLNNGGNEIMTTAALTANTTYNLVSVAYGDAPACSAPASGSVTITVNQPPAFTACPSNLSFNNTSGLCTAVVNYSATTTGTPAPTVTYTFSGATTGSGSGTGSGLTFNKGVTTVTITASNVCTPNATCTFTITVNDAEAPAITCPANVFAQCTSAIPAVDIASVTATDNCGTPTVTHVGDVITLQTCANRYTLTRSYKATDATGNSSTCVQIITVDDQTAPTITTAAGSLNTTVSCSSDVPAVSLTAIAATDNCAGVVTISHVSDVTTAGSCANRFTVTRTYRATDVCGNFSNFVQTITVDDQTAPTITTAAGSLNTTVSCAALVPAVSLTAIAATDNCAGVVTISHVSDVTTAGSCANRFTVTRTYRATDVCGNFSNFVQTITVDDQTAPTITTAAGSLNTTVSCAALVPAVSLTAIAATDNCAGVVTISHVSDVTTAGSCANRFTVTRTYRATDVCGNFSNFVQTITVNDITAPVISSIPANTTVSCVSEVPAANDGAVTATDNCGGTVTITHSADVITPGSCANRYSIARTYTATDICGNFSTQTQTITVDDQTAPIFTAPNNITIYTSATCTYDASVAATGDVTNEADNCSTGLNATFVDVNVAGPCQGSRIITRTWSLVDNCGNAAANQIQIITVSDNTAPTFTAPNNITIYTSATCTYDASVTATGDVTNEADNCSTGLNATFVDVNVSGPCQGSRIITRTWSLADNCGNAAANQIQTITVSDNTAPTFTRPADKTIYTSATCTYDASVTATGDVTNEADNCSTGLNATFTDVTANGPCQGSKIITRTWSLVDNCGNAAANQVQTITVSDNTAPTFTRPADKTIYTSATCTYDATIAATGDVTNEADNCSIGLNATFVDVNVAGPCQGSRIITRTWSLVDNCGNAAANQIQIITVSDNTAPTFTAPNNITIYTSATCTYDATVAATGDVTNEADNCSTGLNATFTDVTANGPCQGSKIITRTWSLVDNCGNAAANQVQIITVSDNTAPTFTRPANIIIYTSATCTYDASTTATGDVINEADNCSTGLNATFVDVNVAGSCEGSRIITRTWSLADNCGNAAANQTQTITVSDNTAPTFTAPASIEIFTSATCTYDASTTATGDVTNEADNCSTGLNATFVDVTANGPCQGSKIITRTWSLVDNCGNAAANQTQTITVSDNTAPTFTRPADKTIYTSATCTYDATIAATGDVTSEADNCSTGLNATFVDVNVAGACQGSRIITRTWSLADNCGNAAANQIQTITVSDNTAPTFTRPADKTIYTSATCTYDASVTATGDVTNEADNCSTGLNATFTDVTINGPCQGSKIITRTWSLVDNCGNAAANQTQTITVSDNTAPTFTRPADKTIYTSATCTYDATVAATGDVTNEADNCSTGLNATFVDVNVAGACQGSRIITRTWSLADNCGNAAANQIQTITVSDNTAPTFTRPSDKTIYTSATCTYDASTTATGDVTNEADNCSTGLNATFVDANVAGPCQGSRIITRTWSLADNCGNAAATQVQTITVSDNTAPTFTRPADKIIYTSATCTYDASVTTTGDVINEADNCSTGLNATFVDVNVAGPCQGSRIITRTWSLGDNCGNAAANQIQTITVSDNTAPTFTRPADKTIYTSATCTYDASVATTGDVTNEADNCSTGLNATFVDVNVAGACQGSRIITRTWSLADNCGNAAATQVQTITVSDNIAPVITCPSGSPFNRTTNTGLCTYKVVGTEFNSSATDNCSTPTLAWSVIGATTVSGVGTMAGVNLNFGINTITWTATDACNNSSACSISVNVNNVNTTTTVTVSPTSQQYSDKVTFTATVTNCNGNATGGTVTFSVGTQVMGTAPVLANGTATLIAALLEPSYTSGTTTPPNGTMAPGSKVVTASFAAYNNSLSSTGTCALTITKEDAVPYYTGSTFVSTASTTSSTATVSLSATVKDITAVLPASDANAGDIRNARVRFVNRDLLPSATGYYLSDWLVPGLVNISDTKTGVVNASWTATISGDAQQFTIGVIVDNGYYIRNASDDNAVITISKPLADFVTGGGYIIMSNATGLSNPGNGKRNNFGFNIKRTKTGVLQGNINTIIRTADNKVIQVKGNSMTSLSVSPATSTSPAKAVFVGKANIQDITDPLNVISIAGNQTLQVSMTDRGEPGFGDDISILVYRDNNVYFSSSWDGTATQLQVLDGGNIKIHSTGSFATGTTNSAVTISSSLNPSTVGQAVTFTATVTGGGAIKPTGTISFVDVNTNSVLGTVAVNTTTGAASIIVGSLSAGTHQVAAYYSGDSRYAVSGASVTQLVSSALLRGTELITDVKVKGLLQKIAEIPLQVAIGPNPTEHYFTLQVLKGGNEPVEISVTDFMGRPVEILKLPKDQTLNFGDHYFAGSYFIQIRQGKQRIVKKIIKL